MVASAVPTSRAKSRYAASPSMTPTPDMLDNVRAGGRIEMAEDEAEAAAAAAKKNKPKPSKMIPLIDGSQ